MIPYSYKFVDFAGTDLSEINGLVVDGIYQRIIDAINRCGEVVLYNWYFASIPIAPSYCSIEVRTDRLIINDVVEIRDDDTVWVPSLIPPEPPPPPPPVLVQLTALSNGQYLPSSYDADGFSEVNVSVPSSGFVLSGTTEPAQSLGQDQDLYVQYDQTYGGNYEYGITAEYRKVNGVWVPYVDPTYIDSAIHVWTASTSGFDAAMYVQEGRYYDGAFHGIGDVQEIVYTTVQGSAGMDIGLINLRYGSPWIVKALQPIYFSGNLFQANSEVNRWDYSATVDYLYTLQQI